MKLFTILIATCFVTNGFCQLPNSDWTIQIGGSGDQEGNDLVYDQNGNVYVIGIFFDTVDFDPGPAENFLISATANSAFVAKYDSLGNYIWAKQFEGSGNETAMSIALDDSSNVYVGGGFNGASIDMDPGLGTHIFNNFGDGDIFITKLSSSGNLLWAQQFGGTGAENLTSISLDNQANLYATGYFQNTVDFDPSTGDSTLTGGGMFNSSMFILKLDSASNFIWVNQITSTNWISGFSMCVKDSLICIAGDLEGTADFDPGAGSFNLDGTGPENVFLLEIDTSGNFYKAISIGATNGIDNHSLTIDSENNITISGMISGSGQFDPLSTAGDYSDVDMGGDLYIAKYDSDLNFIWLVATGSNSTCRAYACKADSSGNIYTTGSFAGTVDFNSGLGLVEINSDSGAIFLLKLDPNGNYLNVDQIGTGGFEEGRALELNLNGDITLTGKFYGSTDMGSKTPITTVDFYSDAFVHKRSHHSINLGVNENENDVSVFIYPNPTSGITYLKVEETSLIEVFNLAGQKIIELKTEQGETMLDLTRLEPGVYIIKTSSLYGSSTLKVVRM